MKPRGNEKRNQWLLIKHRDDSAREGDGEGVLAEDRSVASGRAMATIAAGKGRAPKPFMAVGASPNASAVWDSKQGLAAVQRGGKPPRPASVSSEPMPEFIEPQLCESVECP